MHKLFEIPSITLFLCVFCAFLWLKNPRNLRNPLLMKDLRACKVLYNCRETFTNVMSPLQIRLFMQNKAKFRKVKLNVNNVLTKDYEQMDTWSIGKKQSQTNPNKAKFKKAKMNVTSIITKDYENMSNWAICENEPNSNPTCRGIASGVAGNKLADAPWRANFRANIMLLRKTINGRRKSLGYYADEIEAPNAYGRAVVGCRLSGVKPRGRFLLIAGAAWPIIDGSGLRI